MRKIFIRTTGIYCRCPLLKHTSTLPQQFQQVAGSNTNHAVAKTRLFSSLRSAKSCALHVAPKLALTSPASPTTTKTAHISRFANRITNPVLSSSSSSSTTTKFIRFPFTTATTTTNSTTSSVEDTLETIDCSLKSQSSPHEFTKATDSSSSSSSLDALLKKSLQNYFDNSTLSSSLDAELVEKRLFATIMDLDPEMSIEVLSHETRILAAEFLLRTNESGGVVGESTTPQLEHFNNNINDYLDAVENQRDLLQAYELLWGSFAEEQQEENGDDGSGQQILFKRQADGSTLRRRRDFNMLKIACRLRNIDLMKEPFSRLLQEFRCNPESFFIEEIIYLFISAPHLGSLGAMVELGRTMQSKDPHFLDTLQAATATAAGDDTPITTFDYPALYQLAVEMQGRDIPLFDGINYAMTFFDLGQIRVKHLKIEQLTGSEYSGSSGYSAPEYVGRLQNICAELPKYQDVYGWTDIAHLVELYDKHAEQNIPAADTDAAAADNNNNNRRQRQSRPLMLPAVTNNSSSNNNNNEEATGITYYPLVIWGPVMLWRAGAHDPTVFSGFITEREHIRLRGSLDVTPDTIRGMYRVKVTTEFDMRLSQRLLNSDSNNNNNNRDGVTVEVPRLYRGTYRRGMVIEIVDKANTVLAEVHNVFDVKAVLTPLN